MKTQQSNSLEVQIDVIIDEQSIKYSANFHLCHFGQVDLHEVESRTGHGVARLYSPPDLY